MIASVGLAEFFRKIFLPSRKSQVAKWKRSMKGNCKPLKQAESKSEPMICVGLKKPNEPHELPLSELAGSGHYFIQGGTGSGKSFWNLHMNMALLPFGVPIILVDMKGETAQILLQKLIPSYLATLPDKDQKKFLKNFTYVNPFLSDHLLPFNILKRIPNIVPSFQAREISSLIETSVGAGLGHCQLTTLMHALKLCIEQNQPFSSVRRLLIDPFFRDGLLKNCPPGETKQYFLLRFEKESPGSVNALINRLELFTSIPSIRKMLECNDCAEFGKFLDRGVTILDLGSDVPLGAEGLQKFIATLFLTRLTRAVLSRKVDEGTPRALVVVDEFQEALSGGLASSFERILCLARSKRVFYVLITQLLANVEKVSPALVRVINTNCNYQVLFKMNLDDAKSFAPILPVRHALRFENMPWGTTAKDLEPSRGEQTRQLLKLLTSLPTRNFFFWNRFRANSVVHLVSPTLNVPKSLSGKETKLKEVLLENRYELKKQSREVSEVREDRSADEEPVKIREETCQDLKTSKTIPRPQVKGLCNLG